MKTYLRLLFIVLVSVVPALADTVKVSASKAIRIAVVDTEGRAGDTTVLDAFAPCFERSLALIYGAETPVEFVRLSSELAADGLRRGMYDASLLFGARLPQPIRRTGFHALRAASGEDRAMDVSYLILRQEEPALDALLANAFNAAVNHEEVRRAYLQRRQALLLASR